MKTTAPYTSNLPFVLRSPRGGTTQKEAQREHATPLNLKSPMLEERLLLPEDLPPGLEKVYRSLLHADPVQMHRQTLLGDGGDDALDHNGDMPLQPGGILAQLVLVLGHCDPRDA